MANYSTEALALSAVALNAHVVKKLMEKGLLSNTEAEEIFNRVIEEVQGKASALEITNIIREIAGQPPVSR